MTPLLEDEDLRSLLQQGEDQLDQLIPLEDVDLRADDIEDVEDSEDGFALIDEDYTEDDNLIADLEIDAIIEDITGTENLLEDIVTTTPGNLPQVVRDNSPLLHMRNRLTMKGNQSRNVDSKQQQ